MDRGAHSHVGDRLDLYAAGALGDVEWLTVRAHLTDCESCQDELTGLPFNRAMPRRIPPTPVTGRPPGWSVVFGTSFVAALVAFGLGYALHGGF